MTRAAKLLASTLLKRCDADALTAAETIQALACTLFAVAEMIVRSGFVDRRAEALAVIADLVQGTWHEAELAQLKGEKPRQALALAVADELISKYTLHKH